MADHQQPHQPKGNEMTKVGVVTTTDDRGLFDFLGKEEVKPMTDTNCNMKNGEMEEIHGGSSSSSDEEEGGEKKKKTKGLKEKIKGKVVRHSEKEKEKEKEEVVEHKESPAPEEKKGIIEKIKEKLPGQHKNDEMGAPTSATPPPEGGEPKEQKKGFMEKIKEKLPGHHKNEEDAHAKDI